MTKAQKIYRIIRPFTNREDARYAAIRLAAMGYDEFLQLRAAA